MKEASGELNLTLITVVAIGLIAALFAALWPGIQNKIKNNSNKTANTLNNLNVGMTFEENEFTDYVETELF